MEFLQAIPITGLGRESCTASSQFFFSMRISLTVRWIT